MRALWAWVRQSFSDDGTLLGYALVLVIIALAVIGLLVLMQPITSQIFMDTDCLQCTNK